MFKTPYGSLIVDKAFILIGNVPIDYYGYFANLSNWTTRNGELIYTGEIYNPIEREMVTDTPIDPEKVYIHFKIGNSHNSIQKIQDYPYDWKYFFPKSNKTYSRIQTQLIDKIRIIDCTHKYGPAFKVSLKKRAYKMYDPRFDERKQKIYGVHMNHIGFAGINTNMI